MHLALTIPELLQNIFVHLEKPSNARNLLVCGQWATVCKGVLWRNIDTLADFYTLIRLLGPLEIIEDHQIDVRILNIYLKP